MEKSRLELNIIKLLSSNWPHFIEETTSSCPDKTESNVIL